MDQLIKLYKSWSGNAPQKVERLPKSGSNREYVRMYDDRGKSVIGVIGPSNSENHCFVYLSKHFKAKGLPVPDIYAFNETESHYLQEDLGTRSLYDALKNARDNNFNYGEHEAELMRRAVRLLAHVQVEGAQDIDYKQCLEPVVFNEEAAMFDLNYFKYCFLRTADLGFDEVRYEVDMKKLAKDLVACSEGMDTFRYCDYQARNIMLNEQDEPYLIDYQDGQRGPVHYDVASFLWQASAHYPQTLRDEIIAEYINELSKMITFDKQEFREQLQLFVLFRIMQVLGAYGLRGYFERKKYFIDSIPAAIQNLRRILMDGACSAYPYMENVLNRLVDLPKFKEADQAYGTPTVSKYDDEGPLVVYVYSFSFQKGIPEDSSVHAGGYTFDCRSIHNPGRYEPYKELNGLNPAVIKFLEDDGEVQYYLDNVYKLADTHIERYLQRGLAHLMFSFGCTGGQHRSVYCAQHLAEHISTQYGVEVHLIHREQKISHVFDARKL